MQRLPQNATRERIMDTAEALFMARGYNAVKLRDIADEVGMKHASLYYYVPKGKDQLFAEVVRRSMERHHSQLTRVIDAAGDDFKAQIYAVSDWFVTQPPIDLVRMAEVDLAALSAELQTELREKIMFSLNEPVIRALHRANDSGVATVPDPGMASMALLTMLQGVLHIPADVVQNRRLMFGRDLVDMLFDGWLARSH